MEADSPRSAFDEFTSDHPYPVSHLTFTRPDSSEGRRKRQKRHFYSISGYAARLIRSVLDASGFTETKDEGSSQLIVGSALPEDVENALLSTQRTNHYTKTFSLGSKEGYHKLMVHLSERLGSRPSFYPESYLVPAEITQLRENIETSDLWIAKPAGGARGIGIQLVKSEIPKIRPGRRMIIQKYIKNPLLINDLKFDLRFYVAVTSLDPLRVYLFENGLVRIATKPYKDNIENVEELAAHLTNFSINKDMQEYVETNDIEKDGTGNKWSHAPFWAYLENLGFNVPEIKKKIEDAISQVMIAALPTFKEQQNHRCAFELFGFDVMIDENQEIYIIEVNVSPALGTSSELDRFIKTPLVEDLFNISLIPKIKKPEIVNAIEDIMKGDDQLAKDFVVVAEYEMAKEKQGKFHCIWPTVERWDEFNLYLESKTDNDETLVKWIGMQPSEQKAFLEERYQAFKDKLPAD